MSQQLQITGGAKVRSLEGVITGSTGVLGSLPINGSNGIPQLDSNGKILVSQLPNSVMEYLGTWNVTTNTPTLVNGTGNAGDVYLVEGAATGGTSHNFGAGAITFYNGDQVIYSGTIWQRASGATGSVTSVAVTETGDALTITGSPITTSGTINIGFAGTSAQYVAGNGTLVTFPTLTGYVPYTGATNDVNLGLFDLKTAKVWLYDVPNDGYGSMELTDGVLHFEDADGHSMVTMEDGYLTIAQASTVRALLNVSALTVNRDFAFPNASGTLALTSDLSGFITGSGTTNYIPKWTGSTALGNSLLFDNGTNVGIGTASPSYKLDVNGTGRYLGNVFINPSNVSVAGLEVASEQVRFRPDSTNTTTPKLLDIFTGSGNAVLFSVGGYGTFYDTDMSFYTSNASTGPNSTPNLFLKSNGNVGIYNYNPSYRLDVTGTARFTDSITGTNANFNYVSFNNTATAPPTITGFSSLSFIDNGSLLAMNIKRSDGQRTTINIPDDGFTHQYDFPTTDGTIALTSNLSSYVPTSRTLTINGTTYDLSADRSWTVSGSQWTTSGSNIYYNTGNVGIGTASPVPPASRNGLVVRGNSNGGEIMLQNTDTTDGSAYGLALVMTNNGGGTNSGNAAILNRNNGHLNFATNNSDRMIITSTGNVGIGTSSPSQPLHVYTTSTTTSSYFETNSANSYIGLKSTSGVCYIGNVSYAMTFEAGGSERMRIGTQGNVGIGVTNDPDMRLYVKGQNSTSSQFAFLLQNSNGNNLFIVRNDGGFYTGSAPDSPKNVTTANAANVFIDNADSRRLYRSTSSLKYKTDIRNYNKGIAEVLQMRPVYYKGKGKNDNNKDFAGLIAEEIHDLGLTEFVQYAQDGTPDALAYQNMVALLVKAIQEQQQQIDELKSLINK